MCLKQSKIMFSKLNLCVACIGNKAETVHAKCSVFLTSLTEGVFIQGPCRSPLPLPCPTPPPSHLPDNSCLLKIGIKMTTICLLALEPDLYKVYLSVLIYGS